MEGTWRRVGLGCMMGNSQRINTKLKKKEMFQSRGNSFISERPGRAGAVDSTG